MNHLPEPTERQPHATQAGQPTPDDYAEAARLLAALDALPTSYRDETPVPAVGPTPPVAQPGRPPMSSKATDDSVRMLSAGFLTLCAGTATAAVLHFSADADPTVIGLIAAAPAGLAVPVFALSRLARNAKQALEAQPAEHHHHYNGPVVQDHRTTTTHTRGIWASTRNSDA